MPGYVAKPETHDASDVAEEAAARTCLGLPTANYLARNFGTAFTKGDLEVDSSADVAASAAEAMRDLHALAGPRGATCGEQAVRQAITQSGATVQRVSATNVPVTVDGSDGAFGYRLSLDATDGGQTVHVTGYEVASLVGQVEIDVTEESSGAETLTLDQVTSLLAKATGRVRAAT